MTLTILNDLVQGTEPWHAARRGIVTASVVGRLLTLGSADASGIPCPVCAVEVGPCMAVSRKTPAPMRTFHADRLDAAAELPPVVTVANNETSRNLTAILVAERIAGFSEDLPMTSDMWRGVDTEPPARDTYSKRKEPATEVGFMRLDADWGTLGYSPDGLIGDEGLIEIKAPRAKSHVLTVIADEVPQHYMAQCQAGLLVSGRKWLDFVPYVGGLPMWTKRVHPDPKWHAAIKAAVTQFEKTAAEMVAAYTQATVGLAPTERLPDPNIVELKLA